MNNNLIYRLVTLIVLLLLQSVGLWAQTNPPNPNPPPPGLPIDGFIWFGIMLAVGYGIYRVAYKKPIAKTNINTISTEPVEVQKK